MAKFCTEVEVSETLCDEGNNEDHDATQFPEVVCGNPTMDSLSCSSGNAFLICRMWRQHRKRPESSSATTARRHRHGSDQRLLDSSQRHSNPDRYYHGPREHSQ